MTETDLSTLLDLFAIDEGDGLSGRLFRCYVCHRGWHTGGTFPQSRQHFTGCPVEKLEAALAASPAPPEPPAVSDDSEMFKQRVELGIVYTNKIIVESDGYPMLHDASTMRTLLVNAFIAGMEAQGKLGAATLHKQMKLNENPKT